MSYTTKAKIEAYLDKTISISDATIVLWVDAVEIYIKNYTGKDFEGASETRYYDGNGERFLDIDDLTSVSAVALLDIDGDVDEALTEGDGNDFLLEPLNTTPKTRIVLTGNSSIGAFTSGIKRIKVTGVFGHSVVVPADIELVSTMLVSNIINKGSSGGEIKQESLGDYSVTFVDEVAEELGVADMLDKYIKFSF